MPKIAVTFDDDPKIEYRDEVPVGTSEMLRVIESLNQGRSQPIRVTLFAVGVNIEKCLSQEPRLITRILEGGHEIANHSYSHPQNFHQLSVSEAIAEVGQAHDLIQRIFGVTPRYFRPPYGLIRAELKQAIIQAFPKYQIAGWDRHDEKESYTPTQVRDVVLANARDRQIILLHNWYQNTLWSLRGIFEGLSDRGFDCTTMQDLNVVPPLTGLKGW
jgi:peptidoglycan/xylan/chitin deacetylase (PgdA/CDA1 family)